MDCRPAICPRFRLEGRHRLGHFQGAPIFVDLSAPVTPQKDCFAAIDWMVQAFRTMGRPTGPVAYVAGAAETNALTRKFCESVNEMGGFTRGNFRIFTGHRETCDWLP